MDLTVPGAGGISGGAVWILQYKDNQHRQSEGLQLGEYMDPQVLELFEKETGISVTYDEYETNESMYPIIAKGAADYDLICPSDYMIQKMSDEGLLEPINWSRIPNAKKY